MFAQSNRRKIAPNVLKPDTSEALGSWFGGRIARVVGGLESLVLKFGHFESFELAA